MSEENIKRMYETVARIISEREHVDIKVTIVKKDEITDTTDNKSI